MEEDGSKTSNLLNAVTSGRLDEEMLRLQADAQEALTVQLEQEPMLKDAGFSSAHHLMAPRNAKDGKDFIDGAAVPPPKAGASITNAGEQWLEPSVVRATVGSLLLLLFLQAALISAEGRVFFADVSASSLNLSDIQETIPCD